MTKKLHKNKTTENLLIEIGAEEIPARFIEGAVQLFRKLAVNFLKEHRIIFDESSVRTFFTPRRLTVFVSGVVLIEEDRLDLIKGPPVTIGVDPQGQWTQAALSFASRQGLDPKSLVRRPGEKGEYLYAEKKIVGRKTLSILRDGLKDLIKEIKFPKSMHWGQGCIYFSRPLRWIVSLLGSTVIRFELDDVKSGRLSYGYRWVKKPVVSFPKADQALYIKILKEKGVYADSEERFSLIERFIQQALGTSKKIHDEDKDILNEVSNLVEFPNVGLGTFDEKYLSIPPQVLSTVIKYHQKYLPVYDKSNDKLLPFFITIFNGPKTNLKTVVRGNERVLRARLADAAFFWEQDQSKKLSDCVSGLKNVVFQENLGTYFDKSQRIGRLVKFLAEKLNLEPNLIGKIERSAYLCKADLVTHMVGEFTNLQGVIGRVYAKNSLENDEVAQAIEEHYLPISGSEGKLPTSFIGGLLSLADKLDTIVGGFQFGLAPSGSQDPYGLRRLSSGALRILYEKNINLSLKEGIEKSLEIYGFSQTNAGPVLKFFQERLENLFHSLKYHHDLVRVVVERQYQMPAKAFKILVELQKALGKSFFSSAATIIERTYNIIKGGAFSNGGIQESLLKEKEELDLYRVYKSNYDGISKLIESGHFIKALTYYAEAFYEPLSIFFDKVLVNAKEESLRQNRYALLRKIHELFALNVADISKVAHLRHPEGEDRPKDLIQ